MLLFSFHNLSKVIHKASITLMFRSQWNLQGRRINKQFHKENILLHKKYMFSDRCNPHKELHNFHKSPVNYLHKNRSDN